MGIGYNIANVRFPRELISYKAAKIIKFKRCAKVCVVQGISEWEFIVSNIGHDFALVSIKFQLPSLTPSLELIEIGQEEAAIFQ